MGEAGPQQSADRTPLPLPTPPHPALPARLGCVLPLNVPGAGGFLGLKHTGGFETVMCLQCLNMPMVLAPCAANALLASMR